MHGGLMRLRGVFLAAFALFSAVMGVVGVGWAVMTPPQPAGGTIGPPVTVSPPSAAAPTTSPPREKPTRTSLPADDRKRAEASRSAEAESESGSESEDETTSPDTIAPTWVRTVDDDDRSPTEDDGEKPDDD
jgi:hypothetical protein